MTTYQISFSRDEEISQMNSIIDYIVLSFFMMDLIFNFMTEYQDPDTFKYIKEHRKIAWRYVTSLWFFIDFAATFPFTEIAGRSALWARLFRLFRLPKLIRFLDLSRINRLLKSFFDSGQRQDKIVA